MAREDPYTMRAGLPVPPDEGTDLARRPQAARVRRNPLAKRTSIAANRALDP